MQSSTFLMILIKKMMMIFVGGNVFLAAMYLQVAMYANVFLAMANFVKSRGIIHHNFHESEIVDIPKCYYTR